MADSTYTSIIWLTQGKYAIVDNCDYDWIMQWKWHFNGGYAVRNEVKNRQPLKRFIMHREINNTPSGMLTDHINRVKLDNRRENLRSVTKAQNQMNKAKGITNRQNAHSKYKGIQMFRLKTRIAWVVYLNRQYIGFYKTEIEAAKAYNEAALAKYGEYACLNPV